MIGEDMNRVRGNNKQAGMASFMVTTVLILVISLIIIGFSQVARRNMREALDRQLNAQAFYAAESGVNAAVAVIQSKVSNGQLPLPKTDCTDYANYPEVKLSGDDVKVSCMLVDTQLGSMFYDQVTESAPTVVPVVPATAGTSIGQLTLTWRNKTGGANASQGCPSAGSPSYTLPARGSWSCGHGILRTDLAPQPSGSSPQALTSFFYPHRVNGTITSASAPVYASNIASGKVMGHCSDADNDPKCIVSISGLNAPIYYLNLRSIYRNSTVTVSGLDTTGTPLEFKGQVIIDVTAKAQDVLKRIQVRVPLMPQNTSTTPAYGVESSGSVCKRFAVEPNYYASDPVAGCP